MTRGHDTSWVREVKGGHLEAGHVLTVAGASVLGELLQGGECHEAVLTLWFLTQVMGLPACVRHMSDLCQTVNTVLMVIISTSMRVL